MRPAGYAVQATGYRGSIFVSLAALLLVLLVNTFVPVSAGPIDAEGFNDPAMTVRYQALIADLRCLVCQNQNIAGSNADLAKDLRQQVREMMTAGKSDAEIVQFMVDRYGDFVLYKPPINVTTLFLWIGPFVLLFAGVALVVVMVRHRGREPEAHLTGEQHAAARRLLEEDEDA